MSRVRLHLALILVACSLPAADWNQWRGPQRNGAVLNSPPLRSSLPDQGLQPLWVSEEVPAARNGGWSSPVVADGKVYVFVHTRTQQAEVPKRKYPWLAPDKRGHLTAKQYEEYERNRRDEDEALGKLYKYREIIYCFDLATGKTLWKNERDSIYTRFLQSGSPTVVDGKLFILTAGRKARCVAADNGRDLWENRLPGDFRDEFMMSSFAVASGVALVHCGHLFAVSVDSGELLWQGDPKTTRGTHSSPVVWNSLDGPLFVANVSGGQTVCLDPKTGKELWRVDSQANLSTPVIAGNRLVTLGSSRKGGLRCFAMTPNAAEELWVYQGLADKGSSPVIVDNHVYAQGEHRLACVNLDSGEAVWEAELELARPQYSSLIAADGKVFYAQEGLLCFAASPGDYTPILQAKIDKSGLMASEASFRKLLKLDEVAKEQGGQEKAARLFREAVGRHGPLECASPALADGKLIVRLKNAIACYNLAAGSSE